MGVSRQALLSAKAEHVDRVRGFVRGADDYVTKPFHYPELLVHLPGFRVGCSPSFPPVFGLTKPITDSLP
jgi:hypothetical protein